MSAFHDTTMVRHDVRAGTGVTDRFWEMSDVVALVDRFDDAQPRKKVGRKPKAR